MTENERVKQLRKARGLTLEQFGERLGIGKSTISAIETGQRSLTRQNLLSICREFGVREEWLRDGTGEMEYSTDTFDLDELADKHHATALERELIKAYFELDEQMRKIAVEKFSNVFGRFDASSEPERISGMTREQYHAELDRQLDDEKKAAEEFSDSGRDGSGFKMA